jgi:hypothetical protein
VVFAEWRRAREALGPAIPEPPPVEAAPRASERAGRDVPTRDDLAPFVNGIVNAKLGTIEQKLVETLGQIIAHERKRFRGEVEAIRTELKAATAEMRAELAAEVLKRLDRQAAFLERVLLDFEARAAILASGDAALH